MSKAAEFYSDVSAGVARSSPPFAIYAFTLNDVLVLVGIISAILNTAYLVWKWRRDIRRDREEHAG